MWPSSAILISNPRCRYNNCPKIFSFSREKCRKPQLSWYSAFVTRDLWQVLKNRPIQDFIFFPLNIFKLKPKMIYYEMHSYVVSESYTAVIIFIQEESKVIPRWWFFKLVKRNNQNLLIQNVSNLQSNCKFCSSAVLIFKKSLN